MERLRVVPLIVIAFVLASSPVSAKDKVRLQYSGFGTPDYLVYELLVGLVSDEAKVRKRKNLVNWVYTEINLRFDDQAQAWLFPDQPEHSREDAQKLITHMVSEANRIRELNLRADRELLCPSEGITETSRKFEAFKMKDIRSHEIAKDCLAEAELALDIELMSSLRSWMARVKKGYRGRWYNYDVLWKGKESAFEQIHQEMCHQIAGGTR